MECCIFRSNSVNPETGKMPEGITVQTEQVMKNIGAILKEAGYGLNKSLNQLVY